MNIQFSEEEKKIGGAIGTIVENAPISVAKTGVGVAGTALSLGWGIGKALFGAGKVLVNGAVQGVAAAQSKMQQAQTEALLKAQAETIAKLEAEAAKNNASTAA